MRKYSKNFDADFHWYLKMRNTFDFDGRLDKYDITHDPKGVDGKRAFLLLDSTGQVVPTKHPTMLKRLIKTKGSVNLHIKMYAESRADGCLPKVLFEEVCLEYGVPEWFILSVEKQKNKILKTIR